MMLRITAAVAFVLAVSAPFGYSAARKNASRKRPRPAAPAVTAAQRTAALRRLDHYLEASADGALEQPGALAPFFERLYRLSSRQIEDTVHVLHFGDSHTAADEWTGGLRVLFQRRFGDGGSGFSAAGRPFLGYRRFDAHGGATGIWQSAGLRSASGDGYFGLAGVSVAADRPGQSVFLDADGGSIEIQYLQQPGGGRVALYDNQQFREAIATDGDFAPAYAVFECEPGPHRFLLKTLDSRPVRLFGWVADKPGGITYEALGINGAEASVMLRWNREMMAVYVHRRDPGLIVLAYGTNEASDPKWNAEDYRAMLASLIDQLREDAPAASILVVGPGDRWARYRNGWHTVPGIDSVIGAQRAVCEEKRCTLWDTRKRMGGSGAMRDWLLAGLAQPDRVHFTSSGYQRLASTLYGDLMRQFEIFKKTRQRADQTSHGQADQNR